MNKINLTLSGILFVQLGLALAVNQQRPVESKGRMLALPGLQIDQVTKLEVSGPELGSDGSVHTVKILRSGDSWILPEVDDFPVTSKKVDDLLSVARKLTTGPIVTTREVHYKKLLVSDEAFERRIKISMGEGSKVYDFVIGTKPHRDRAHFRRIGESEVYVVPEIDSWDIGVKNANWVEEKYINVPVDKIQRVEILNTLGQIGLKRGPNNQWLVDGASDPSSVDPIKVAALVKQAAMIELYEPLSKVEKKGYGMDSANVSVRIQVSTSTSADPSSLKVTDYRIGAQAVDESYYVKSSDSDYFVKARRAELNGLLEAARGDLNKVVE